ncbi:protein of unknown function [Pseudomonas sp. JV551A1]|uniref:Uncharacterized protein n=1 Tax=Pseudomonas inefficax TaxID=2078786 RepID=A0AAQ1P768_9PSED|nr:protein of unknown function [Pseudomonas sp. JV551A1]SPO60434.1 protein of unknown function [Pseudomonas inefficax]
MSMSRAKLPTRSALKNSISSWHAKCPSGCAQHWSAALKTRAPQKNSREQASFWLKMQLTSPVATEEEIQAQSMEPEPRRNGRSWTFPLLPALKLHTILLLHQCQP